MANYAQNTVLVRFKSPFPDLLKGEEIVSRFVSRFDCDDIYSENCDSETYYDFEACFDSKRSAPLCELKAFAAAERVSIIGVSHEFSSDYSESFQFQ
jgi:hypothetical protein